MNILLLFLLLQTHVAVNINIGLFLRLSTFDPTSNTRIKKGIAYDSSAVAAFVAIDHFNQRKNTIIPEFAQIPSSCNIQFVPHVFDSQSHQKPTLNAFLKARYDSSWSNYKPEIVIGCSRSAVTTPLALLTGIAEVPQVSFYSTSTKLDDTKTYPTFLRTIPSDGLVAQTISELLVKAPYNTKKISMLYVNDAYGTSYMEALQEACVAHNIMFNAYAFSFQNSQTIEDAVKALAQSDGRIIVGCVFDDDLETLMKLALQYNIAGGDPDGKQHLWIFTDSIQGVNNVKDKDARRAMDGSLRVLANGKGRNIDGWRRFEQIWDTLTTDDITQYNSQLPPIVTDPDFKYQINSNYFEKTCNERLEAGEFTDGTPFLFDAIAAMGLAACSSSTKTAKSIYTAAKLKTFDGVSGKVAFNKDGSRSATTSRIELYNIRFDLKGVQNTRSIKLVKTYQNGTWINTDNKIYYSNSNTEPPKWRDEPVINLHSISMGLKTFNFLLVALITLIAGFFFVWTLTYFKEPIIKASQPHFLLLICLGCILSTLTIVPLSLDNHNISDIEDLDYKNMSCRLMVPCFSIGFTLTFSSLFVKQFRVMLVFSRAAKFKKAKTKGACCQVNQLKLYAIIICVILSINVFILIVWDVLSPLQWTTIPLVTDEFGVVTSSMGSCEAKHSTYKLYGNTFFMLIGVFLFLLVIVGNVISFWTRSLPSKFQESKWIAYSMISSFQMFAIGLPLMLIAGEDGNTSAAFGTRSAFVFLNNFSVLILIFLPKIWKHHSVNQTTIAKRMSAIMNRKKLKLKTEIEMSNVSTSKETEPSTSAATTEDTTSTSTASTKNNKSVNVEVYISNPNPNKKIPKAAPTSQ